MFPPHCVHGTPGANFVPEALTDQVFRVPNTADATLPPQLEKFQQILLEKQTLDIFESRHAGTLVERLGPNRNSWCLELSPNIAFVWRLRDCCSAAGTSLLLKMPSKPLSPKRVPALFLSYAH